MESNGVKYLFLTMIVAAASFFIIPNFSFAISEEEKTQALIDFFQNHLVQLRNETKDSDQWCYDFENNLNIGDENNDVYNLQVALQKDGFDTGITETNKQEPTVYFDEKLASLVSGFQMKYKDEILTPNNLQYGNGFVGQATRDKLNKLYGCDENIAPSLTVDKLNKLYGYDKNITPSITVLSPNGGEVLEQGRTYRIRWNSQNLPANSKIHLQLSYQYLNDNHDYETNIFPTLINTGSYDWTIPSRRIVPDTELEQLKSNRFRIRIITDSLDESVMKEDYSDAPFSIIPANSSSSSKPFMAVFLLSGEGQWKIGEKKSIVYSTYVPNDYDNQTWIQLVLLKNDSPLMTIPHEWTIPPTIQPSNDYKIEARLYSFPVPSICAGKDVCPLSELHSISSNLLASNTSDAFSINSTTSPSVTITVLSPNGGEKLAIGQTYSIKWSSQNIPSDKLITISVYNPAKNDIRNMIERVVNNGEIRWTVPTVLDAGEKYYLMIEIGCDDRGKNCIASDISDESFSVVSAPPDNSPSSSIANTSLESLYDNFNLDACDFTDTAEWTISKDVNVRELNIWYKWDEAENYVPYRITKDGLDFYNGVFTKDSCDPYQSSWCNGNSYLNKNIPSGDYSMKVGNPRQCENGGSGGNGFVRIKGYKNSTSYSSDNTTGWKIFFRKILKFFNFAK